MVKSPVTGKRPVFNLIINFTYALTDMIHNCGMYDISIDMDQSRRVDATVIISNEAGRLWI